MTDQLTERERIIALADDILAWDASAELPIADIDPPTAEWHDELRRIADALDAPKPTESGPLYVELTPDAIQLLCTAALKAVAWPEDDDYEWSPSAIEADRVRRLANLLRPVEDKTDWQRVAEHNPDHRRMARTSDVPREGEGS